MSYIEALKALEDWQRGVTGKRRRHPGHAEDDLQMQCVSWFRLQFPQLARLLHHSPNGGRRDAREGARFKQMGTQAGFPDLILLVAAKGYHALLLELKTRTGRQQDSIKEAEEKAKEDDFDEEKEEIPARCAKCDLWQLGEHTLMCGDSTSEEDVRKLMGGVE